MPGDLCDIRNTENPFHATAPILPVPVFIRLWYIFDNSAYSGEYYIRRNGKGIHMKQVMPALPDGRPSRLHRRRKLRYDRILTLCLILALGSCLFHFAEQFFIHDTYAFISPESQADVHEPMVTEYAQRYGVSEYKDWLLAIVDVESGGQGEDVMQSSESLGLDPNSLTTEESIEQGCAYFAALLQKAESLGVDFDAVLQAYNYGTGYLDYVAANGGRHTSELAQEFAKEQSKGEKKTYVNPVAVKSNGGWRYAYGNMFYVALVHNAYEEISGQEPE